MTNTTTIDFENAIAELAKATLAAEAAKKVAKSLKEKNRREAKKDAKQKAAGQEIVQRCEEKGFVTLEGIEKETSPTLDLCYRIIESQPWGFAFNELAQQHEFRGEVAWPEHYGRVLTDPLVLAIRLSLIKVFSLEFTQAQVEDSLKALCYANPFNPVVEYLDSVKWDKVKRIDTWLSTYASATNNKYTGAVGRLWLLGGVARAKHPGIKFDTLLILEGEQGTEKSGVFKVLGGDWFSDADLGDVKNKDAAIQLQGVWIQELPELGTLRRSDLNDLKAFFSRDKDKFRAPHAKVAQTHPRRCINGATGNASKDRGYLVDDTGNRRYWPVKTGAIDYVKLEADRDQIWAEAVHEWGEAIKNLKPGDYRRALVLPKDLWAVAGAEQKSRLLVDPWVEQLKPWLDDPYYERAPEAILGGNSRKYGPGRGYDDDRTYGQIINPYMDEDGHLAKIHSRIILAECLGKSPGAQTREDGRRLRAVMSTIGGWTYVEQLSVGSMKGIGGYTKDAKDTKDEGQE